MAVAAVYVPPAQSSFPLVSFHVEHVIARQHGGGDEIQDLCLSGHWCNLLKRPNRSSLVAHRSSLIEGELVRLFNPRADVWSEHFQMNDGLIEGLSLSLNTPDTFSCSDSVDRTQSCGIAGGVWRAANLVADPAG